MSAPISTDRRAAPVDRDGKEWAVARRPAVGVAPAGDGEASSAVVERGRGSSLAVQPVEPPRVGDAWLELALATRNVFATREWVESWLATVGRARQPLILAVRDVDRKVVGIVPLYLERWGPIRVLRFIGDGAGDDLGPICRPQHRDLVARELMGYLRNRGGWELLIGRTMRADAGWARRLGAHVVNRESSPVIHLENRTWDDFMGERSSHFRQRRRSAKRRLYRDHDVVLRRVERREELEIALAHLFDLHQRLRDGRSSSFLRAEGFHREFLPRAFDAGWLRLTLLEVDSEVAAAVLDYVVGDVVHGYQMGLDRSRGRWFDVRLLVSLSLEAAFEDPSLREFRIGRGGEDYKHRFADDDPGLETVVVGNGPLGRALAAGMYHGRGLRPTVRRAQDWLERRVRDSGP